MGSPKILKQITPAICPHCNKNILIGTQAMMPSVVSVSNEEQIKEVKKTIKERINELKFKEESERDQIIAYLDDDGTLLDNSDIESFVSQIALDQANKLSKLEKNE